MRRGEKMATLQQFPYFIEKAERIKPFWDALNQGKFVSTRCSECEEVHFPPRILCPKCFSTNVEWTELPRKGTVESFTFVEIPPEGFLESYYLAMVRMDQLEKPILARFVGENPPSIGQAVEMHFESIDGQNVPVFKPA